jgi:hypothetical protein
MRRSWFGVGGQTKSASWSALVRRLRQERQKNEPNRIVAHVRRRRRRVGRPRATRPVVFLAFRDASNKQHITDGQKRKEKNSSLQADRQFSKHWSFLGSASPCPRYTNNWSINPGHQKLVISSRDGGGTNAPKRDQ